VQLILEQLGTAPPEQIVISDSPFSIGRTEEPFSHLDAVEVSSLSKRHARIFEESGNFYAADLGSANGSFRNGEQILGNPQVIRSGDELKFGELAFRVKIMDRVTTADNRNGDDGMRLVLTPENETLDESIVVSRFPYLINKYDEAFTRYQTKLPEQLSFISRRHAHIFLRDHQLFIEDLGSTNGTFVSGTALDEHAQKLEDGDTVAFGGDCFVYKVSTVSADDSESLPDELIDSHPADRTVFIDSPTSFSEIFDNSPEPDVPAAKPPSSSASELRSANKPDTSASRRHTNTTVRWRISALIALAALIGAAVLFALYNG
jgi:pSer/pThr/pTyr-binding forkhead associated (FHA) protein